MNTQVKTYNEIIGFHCWENAPNEVSFLRNKHRHRFIIRCGFNVEHDDRQIEIFMQERKIQKYLQDVYGDEMQLGGMSCEMLAKEIINVFRCEWCEVLEDDKGGAYVWR